MRSEHGGMQDDALRALGWEPEQVLDLSVNLNPYGPPPSMLAAIDAARLDRYPDPEARRARRALSKWLNTSPERVVLGAGACELLWTLVHTLGAAGSSHRRAVISTPAFGEVEEACKAFGVPVTRVPASASESLSPDPEDLSAEARRAPTAFVYLCHPGTPTGAPLSWERLCSLARELKPTPLILDESFLSLSDRWQDAHAPLPEHVVRVRSLTKAFTLPGVRVGYAIASPAICEALANRRPAWSVSAAAQAVAECTPDQQGFMEQSRIRLRQDRQALRAALENLGLRPLHSVAPYLAFPWREARSLCERMLSRQGIALRDCASFGMPSLVRMAVRAEGDRARVLSALRAELKGE
ncbi:MAG: histidinol-phosphate transaminase [Myxococcales bacterium]|nr:histidinol-phosphate transaminase [Myxococcales bacterium]